MGIKTSTPNVSRDGKMDMSRCSDVSIIERSPSPPLLISDSSLADLEHSKMDGPDCDCDPQTLAQKRTKKVNRSLAERLGELNSGEIELAENHATTGLKDSTNSFDSAGSEGRARSLESKLLATTLVLKNKEETIRVQAQSLSLAEERIAALSSKLHQPKTHREQQTHPFNTMRSTAVGNHTEMMDVSASAKEDRNIVKTLRDNLSVIEELYRECFYETAKQEELITMLRRSYLEMRLTEREKTDQIECLQSALTSQKTPSDRYEDIAMEVENLKMEISNFLNSSTNNDSGVWECAPAAELRDIAGQLRRLQQLLRTDCICGLEEENKKLKQKNESMEVQIGDLRRKVSDLEVALEDKENMDRKYQKQIEDKENELHRIRQQLTALEQGTHDQGSVCDTLTHQLKQLEDMLSDKTSELLSAQQQVESQELTIRNLREELRKADIIVNESQQVRAEVACLARQVREWRAQLADSRRRLRALAAELRRARDHARRLADHYREKSECARRLQAQLCEAQARGAALCADAQRAVRGVRGALQARALRRREQDDKIKELESIIQTLQSNEGMSASENEPCCSKYPPRVGARRSDGGGARASETPGCSKCASLRLDLRSASEAPGPAPPTPPRRLLRKKSLCVERPCQCPLTREAAAQRPSRSSAQLDVQSCELLHSCQDTPSREESCPEELLERVERSHEALAAAQRRWGRRPHCAPLPARASLDELLRNAH